MIVSRGKIPALKTYKKKEAIVGAEISKVCEALLIDPNMVLDKIEEKRSLSYEERVSLRHSLAEQCMDCVELCSAESGPEAHSLGLKSPNINCFVSVERAIVTAASEDGGSHLEEALMDDNYFDPPNIEGLS